MSAKVTNLAEYRKKKPVEEKSSDEGCKGEVISLCDARRLKASREAGDRLKGLGFPDDHLIGPDEPGEDFGSLLLNLSLDNPNFPYEPHSSPIPKREDMDWVKGIINDEDKE